MANRSPAVRTLTEHVPGPPDAVRSFYVDLHNIRELHPLVVSVTATDRAETDDGYTQTYRVRDRIPLGPLSIPIGYTARVHVPAAGPVQTEALQFPRVRLSGTVSFDPTDGGTRLTEELRISAPWPLATFTVAQAEAAHRDMLRGIRAYFERT